jgi:hypothetical protein
MGLEMALSYEVLSKRPKIFLRLIGIKVKEFDAIVLKLRPLWQEKVIGSYKRQGRRFDNDIPELLMMLLLYYRTYMTQEFIGYLFDLNDSNVCRNIKTLEPLLVQIVSIKKNRKISKDEAESLIIDATEQPCERPKKDQKKYYSGKKKQHTIKTEIRISTKGEIKHVSKPRPGSMHDFALFKTEPPIPPDTNILADSGYQGLNKIHKKTAIPFKKPKNGKLSKEQKVYNKELSKIRVKVENVLGKIKIFKIIGNRYRNKGKGYGIKFNIIAGLVNIKNGFATV